MDEIMKAIKLLALEEKSRGDAMYGKNHSRHEGYAVFHEEFDEFEAEYDAVVLKKAELWKAIKEDANRDTLEAILDGAIKKSLFMAAELVQAIAMLEKMKDFERAGN